MKNYTLIIFVFMLIFSVTILPVNSENLVDYYYSTKEELNFLENVVYSEFDYSADWDSFGYDNNGVYYSRSIGKTIWIGNLDIPYGHAFPTNPSTIFKGNYTGSFEIMLDSVLSYNISAYLYFIYASKSSERRSWHYIRLYNSSLKYAQKISMNFEAEADLTTHKLENGSSVVVPLYYYQPELSDELHYTMLQLQLYLNEGQNWEEPVQVNLGFKTTHNPTSFNDQLEKYNRILNSSENDGSINLSWLMVIPIIIAVFLLLRRRKSI